MKVTGEAVVRADIAAVYAALVDPAVLVRAIPGCQRLEQVEPDAYRATVRAGVAAINGLFDGEVRLTDQAPPYALTLHADGAGAPGTVTAVAKVTLSETGEGATRISYDADATVGGMLGGVGQRMITTVARRTAGDFFAAVEGELSGVRAPAAPAPPEAAQPGPAQPVPTQPAPAQPAAQVWTAPRPAIDPSRQRVRDVMFGATFGALLALLGVLVGAIVAGW